MSKRLPKEVFGRVSNTPGVVTDSTADLTFALMLAIARGLVEMANLVPRGGWKMWGPMETLSCDVHHKTLGISYLIDVDIKGYFDHVDHKWLMRMMKERIVDRTILRLIGKWLKAGVMEEGERIRNEVGVPQGGVISLLLANIYWPISTCITCLICGSCGR